MDEHRPPEANPDFEWPEKEALDAASDAFTVSLRDRLLLWLLRWIAGFAAIAVIVYLWPGLAWLWWTGAAVAALSLVLMFALHYLLRRRVAKTKRRIAEAERLVRQFEEQESSHTVD